MTANRPKMPMPGPLSATTTAAAWLAAGVAIGLVQLDSAENADDDGSGLAEAGLTGRVAAGTAATIPSFAAGTTAGAAAGVTGAGAMPVAGAMGRTGAAGAAGRTGCTGAGAGEGAGAFWVGGAAGAEAVAVVVGAGAGEPDDGGATGVGDSEHGPSGKQAAWAAPAAPVTTVKASMAAAVPGTSAPRRRGRRIMEYLCSRAGPSRAEFVPGIFLQSRAARQIGYCRLSGGSAIWSLRTLPLPTM